MTFIFFVQFIIEQLLDSVFVITRIIKVSVRVITPTSTFIILDSSKTETFNDCLTKTGHLFDSINCSTS